MASPIGAPEFATAGATECYAVPLASNRAGRGKPYVSILQERVERDLGGRYPHILPLYDSGEAGGLLFHVMPNMEGRSLRERLDRERQLGLEEVLKLTGDASALDLRPSQSGRTPRHQT